MEFLIAFGFGFGAFFLLEIEGDFVGVHLGVAFRFCGGAFFASLGAVFAGLGAVFAGEKDFVTLGAEFGASGEVGECLERPEVGGSCRW